MVGAPTHSPYWLAEDRRTIATAACLVLGVLGTGFGAFAFTKMLQEQGPLFAGMVTYLIPTIALGWSWIDQERVTLLQLTALSGVLAMVALVQYGAAGESADKSAYAQTEA